MAILCTLPKEGEQPTYYSVPDNELEKYKQAQVQKSQPGEETKHDKSSQVAAPGSVSGSGDVQAYGICLYHVFDYNYSPPICVYEYYAPC